MKIEIVISKLQHFIVKLVSPHLPSQEKKLLQFLNMKNVYTSSYNASSSLYLKHKETTMKESVNVSNIHKTYCKLRIIY